MSFQKNNTTMNITHTTQPIIHKDDHAIISSYLGTEATEPLKVKLEKPLAEFKFLLQKACAGQAETRA